LSKEPVPAKAGIRANPRLPTIELSV